MQASCGALKGIEEPNKYNYEYSIGGLADEYICPTISCRWFLG